MNKKGFTLIELLAVIALIAIISVTVFYATNGVKYAINKFMWDQKVSLIENAAVRWGEDNKYLIKNSTIDNPYNNLTVDILLERGYLNGDNCGTNDDKKNCIKINMKDDKELSENTNEYTLKVWIERKQIYAEFVLNEVETQEES